jgi:hypothetical protein
VGYEPTIPAFERAKTVHALDRAATVIGTHVITSDKFEWISSISNSYTAGLGISDCQRDTHTETGVSELQ